MSSLGTFLDGVSSQGNPVFACACQDVDIRVIDIGHIELDDVQSVSGPVKVNCSKLKSTALYSSRADRFRKQMLKMKDG